MAKRTEKIKVEMTTACGVFLRQKRESAGLTQSEVRKALKYTSPQFISNWERGLTTPPMETVVKQLASLYSFNPDEYIEMVLDFQRKLYKSHIKKSQ